MSRVLKYISWLFNIKLFITALITLIVSWMIEDWVWLKYGLEANKGIIGILGAVFFLVLFFVVALIIEIVYGRFFEKQRSGYEIRKVISKNRRMR